jgi:predicted O-linked N-acetylglucosamine transferase (SPINDLY family)
MPLSIGLDYIKDKKFTQAYQFFTQYLVNDTNPESLKTKALFYKGVCLTELKIPGEAIKVFKKLNKINPNISYLHGTLINYMMKICDWEFYGKDYSKLMESLNNDVKIIPAFTSLLLSGSEELQLKIAKMWGREKYNSSSPQTLQKYSREGRRIRIGYFSSYFKQHPVSTLMAEFYELHNKKEFEIFAFSYGEQKEDVMNKRIKISFEHFINVSDNSDEEIAALARKHEIDIAIDLNGIGEGNRSLIFSHRVAPIQISYMYAGTMATNYMDYLIADETVIPEASRQFYTEKILNLSNCFMVRDSKLITVNLNFKRKELGLPNSGFVFCSFNQSSKINPETFDSWVRILNKVEDSVLWLLEDNPLMVNNLKLESKKRSIDPKRIVFAKKRPQPFYLGLYKYADLFLDTLPYNAHTTAGDALWADLPVLTCFGTTYAGRVAASHLKAIQLPELITYSREEFEKLAVELANNSKKLKSIKEKLIANKNNTPLFDTKLFVRNFEAALKQILN